MNPLSAVPGPGSDPDRARELLVRELARSRYQESLVERFGRWFSELLDELGRATEGTGGFGVVLGLLVVVVLVALLGLGLSRLRRDGGRQAGSAALVFGEHRRTAAQHRADAEAALAEGRLDDVVVEAVRALSAGLVERGLLPDQPGLTVLETTTAATSRFPDEAAGLQRLRVAFEETRYGDRRADQPTARGALDVEARVRAARPAGVATATTAPAVPS